MLTRDHVSFDLENDEGILTARLSGEIDHHTARIFREEIDRALLRETPRALTLDFSGVGFMDSSGIGLIVGRLEMAREIGATLTLSGLSQRLCRLLELSGVDRLCGIVISKSTEREDLFHETEIRT